MSENVLLKEESICLKWMLFFIIIQGKQTKISEVLFRQSRKTDDNHKRICYTVKLYMYKQARRYGR